ncbi:MAG: metallophosphoesterase [Magnetococcales bacterium]|nr:metallophosphoesterase [Nitrospirota bacterium]
MSEVTVLHVSDLHMEDGHLRDIKIILGALYADLANLRKNESVEPNIVVFTGDLVKTGGNAGEFTLAKNAFIDPLMEVLRLSKDRFFFTPGNHDIDRDKLKSIIATGIRGEYKTTTALNGFFDSLDLKNDPDNYFDNSKNFRALRDSLNNKYKLEANKLFSAYRVNIGSSDIGIVCLNSAWLASGKDGDQGKLLVSERQVDLAMEYIASCAVKIALMHHPLKWLVDFDREDVANRLMKDFSLVLTGHMHQTNPKRVQNAIGSCFFSDGGTLFNGDRKESYQGYTIIKTGHDNIGVYFRRYIDSDRRFDKDVNRAQDGYWEIQLAAKKPSPEIKADAPKLPDTDDLIKSMLEDIQSRLKVPLYIPLKCSHDILIRRGDIDLEDEVDKFFTAQASVLLILGDSGAGKSTFCAWLFAKLKDAYLKDNDAPMPVFIKLGPLYDSVKAGTFVDEELNRYGFNPPAIKRLKQEKGVVFFLDGYDELGDKIRLFQRDWLNCWVDAKVKVIVTCRNQHIFKNDDFHFFYRGNSLTNRPDREGFRFLYIKPFSEKQVDAYLHEFVQTLVIEEAKWKKTETYKELILNIYNLLELSSNPLLLNIIVKTMPSLIQYNKFNAINRNSIYTEYITEWFEKERERLKNSKRFSIGAFDIYHFFEFAEKLAFEMFIEGKIQIELPKKTIFDKKEDNVCLTYELLTSEDSDYIKFRSGCPIQRVKDNTLTFMHKSYQEYFVARRIQQDVSESSSYAMNKKLLTKEPAIINFLTEMQVDNNKLLQIIEESKTNNDIATAASNAATILNVGRFCFSGYDLHGIRIPGADLSCAVLDSTNLSNADLSGVNFRKTFLRDTKMTESYMKDMDFGEIPYLVGHGRYVNSVVISTDGKKIISGSVDRTLRIWDMTTGNMLYTLKEHRDKVNSVAISVDSEKIVSGSDDKTVRIWDMLTGSLIDTLKGHDGFVTSVAISMDGKIVSGSRDNTLRIWDMATGTLIDTLKGHRDNVNSVTISTNGMNIVSGSSDSTLRIWDMATGRLIYILKGHIARVNSVAISADGTKIVSGSSDNTLRIWDMVTGSFIDTLEGHNGAVNSVAISADGTKIVSGSSDNTLRIWDMATGSLIDTLKGHGNDVNCVTISADDTKIVSGSKDKMLRIWDMPTGSLINTLNSHGNDVRSVVISTDGMRIVSGSVDKTLRIWDIINGSLINSITGHEHCISCVAINVDSTKIVSGSWDKTLKIWDVVTGKLIETLKGHSDSVRSVAISADSTKIVSGGSDKALNIWDAVTGRLIKTLKGHEDSVTGVAINVDGTKVVSGSWDRTLRIWDAVTGKLIKTLKGHSDKVTSVAINTDNTKIVSSSLDKKLNIWDMATFSLIKTLEGHHNNVDSVTISVDGNRIVSGSSDKTLRIWDMATGNLIKTLKGHGSSVSSVAISVDGNKIVSGSIDHSIKVWDADTGRLIWTTNPRLFCEGAKIGGVKGLSETNRQLLKQRGAVED